MESKAPKHKKQRLPRPRLLLAALGVMLLGFMLLHVELKTREFPKAPDAFIHYPPAGEEFGVLREQALLLDSAPLFFPTAWNEAGDYDGISPQVKERELFPPFPEIITLRNDELRPVPDAFEKGAPGARTALKAEYWNFFSRFGEQPRTPVKLPERSGYLEIYRLADNSLIRREVMPPSWSLPEGAGLWTPAEFLAAVDPTGLAAPPLLIQGTGHEEADTALRAYFQRPFFFAGFDPGYYKIILGP